MASVTRATITSRIPSSLGSLPTNTSSSQDGSTTTIDELSSDKIRLVELLQSATKNYREIFADIKAALTKLNSIPKSNLNNPALLQQAFEIIDSILTELDAMKFNPNEVTAILKDINSIYCKILTREEQSQELYLYDEVIENHCIIYNTYLNDKSSSSITHKITTEFFSRNNNIIKIIIKQRNIENGFDSLITELEMTYSSNVPVSIDEQDKQLILIDCALKALKTGHIDPLYISLGGFLPHYEHLNPQKLKELLNCICKILKLEISETSDNMKLYSQIADKLCQELNKPENAILLQRINGTKITQELYTSTPHYFLEHSTLKQKAVENKLIKEVNENIRYASTHQKTKFVDNELSTLETQINQIDKLNKVIENYHVDYKDFIDNSRPELHTKIITLYNHLIDEYNHIIKTIFSDDSDHRDLDCEILPSEANASDILNKNNEILQKFNQLNSINPRINPRTNSILKTIEDINFHLIRKDENLLNASINILLKQINESVKSHISTEGSIQYLSMISRLIECKISNNKTELQQLINQPKILIIELQTQALGSLLTRSDPNTSELVLRKNFMILLKDLNVNLSHITHEMLDEEGNQKIQKLKNIVNNNNNIHDRINSMLSSDPSQVIQEINNIIAILNNLKKEPEHFGTHTTHLNINTNGISTNGIKVRYVCKSTGKKTTINLLPIKYILNDKTFIIYDQNLYNHGQIYYQQSIPMRLAVLLYTKDLTPRNPEQQLQIIACEINNILEIKNIYDKYLKKNKIQNITPDEPTPNFYEVLLRVEHDRKFSITIFQFRRAYLCLLLNVYLLIKEKLNINSTVHQNSEKIDNLLKDKKNHALLAQTKFTTQVNGKNTHFEVEISKNCSATFKLSERKGMDILLGNATEEKENVTLMPPALTTTSTLSQQSSAATPPETDHNSMPPNVDNTPLGPDEYDFSFEEDYYELSSMQHK